MRYQLPLQSIKACEVGLLHAGWDTTCYSLCDILRGPRRIKM